MIYDYNFDLELRPLVDIYKFWYLFVTRSLFDFVFLSPFLVNDVNLVTN